MPKVSVQDVGAIGLIEDVQSYAATPEAWSTVSNARMNEQGAGRMLGEVRSLGTDVTPWTAQPYWLFHAKNIGAEYWVGAGAISVLARGTGPGFVERDVTRQSAGVNVNYGASEDLKWNGEMFQEYLVINNSADEPQYWDLGGATRLANFSTVTDWPTTTRCAVMRSFNKFLVALNVTKNTTKLPHLVKWSHPADPGSIPLIWNEADPTHDAGEYPLTDSEAPIIDGLKLGANFFIYKGDSIYRMRLVGGQNIFAFDPMIGTQGLLAPNCVARFGTDLEMHIALGTDDLYIHNGQAINSIVDKKLKRWLFNQIDVTKFNTCFVTAYEPYHEIWICFPESGALQPTMALIWNWKDSQFTVRDLCKYTTGTATRTSATTGTPCIAVGTVTTSDSEPWSADSNPWSTDTSLWAGKTFSPVISRLFMVDRSGQKYTYLLDQTYSYDGFAFETKLERIGIAITARDQNGKYTVDTDSVKLCQGIWPRVEGDVGTVVFVSLGTQMTPDAPVSWTAEVPYIIGTTEFCDFYESGRIFSVRFRTVATTKFNLTGYDIDITPMGVF